jgi:thioredoxin 1
MNEDADKMSANLLPLSILCLVLALAPASGLQEFPDSPVTVKDGNLDSLVKLYSPLVIDCWKIGCGSCKLFSPTFDEMAQDLRGQVVFGKLCIDQNRKTKQKYHVSGYPTLLVFKNGTLVYSHVGNHPKSELEGLIRSSLGLDGLN